MTFIETIYSRPGLEKAWELFKEKGRLVLIAPTGYGKTVLSLKLYRDYIQQGPWGGLIHVAPFRALVRQIYSEKFKHYVPTSGYQSLDYIEPSDKSPYFLRDLVVTTLDSFIYNLFKIPVAELSKVYKDVSQGHYYPIQLSIFTSIVVFDEAHIYLGDLDENASIASIVAGARFLSKAGVPLIVETATMHSDLVSTLSRNILEGSKVVYVGCENIQVQKLRARGVDVEVVRDRGFESANSFKWRTELIDDNRIIEVVKQHCGSDLVLLITNTVKRAVEIYDTIIGEGVCEKAVLLHGLLSNKDREKAISAISKASAGVVVSTQVVEAGVEIPSRVLITDPAPPENLAQRAGRLCREKYGNIYDECRREGPLAYIVKSVDDSKIDELKGPYDAERMKTTLSSVSSVLQRGKAIDWRLTCDGDGTISFVKILEDSPGVQTGIPKASVESAVLEEFLKSDATPKALIEILSSSGLKLTRSDLLVNILINPQEVCERELEDLSDLETVAMDISRLLEHRKRGRQSIVATVSRDGKEYLKLAVVRAVKTRVKSVYQVDCSVKSKFPIYYKELTVDEYMKLITPDAMGREMYVGSNVITLLVASEGSYVRGRGLVAW